MSHHCPDDMTLAALFDGRLSPAEREALHGRMSDCPACQEALVLIGLGLDDEARGMEAMTVPPALEARARSIYADVPGPVLRGARIAVRRIRGVLTSMADALAPIPMPALAVRGAEADAGLRYELDVGVIVELILTDGGARSTHLFVRPLDAPVPRSRVVLMRDGQVEASLALEAEGVRLPPLMAGRSVLRFEVPGRADTLLPLEL